MKQQYIVGWGHTPFGKLDNMDFDQLIRDAALPAIESAGLTPSDIDAIFVGHFNAGFVQQDFSGALMGVGGVLSMGCTVGQAITGMSTLAIGSMLTFVAIVAGAVVTMKVQYWRMMREA